VEKTGTDGSVNRLAIAMGLILGLAFGIIAAASGSEFLIGLAVASRPLGQAFVNAIQMVVIPLVVVTVFLGVVRLGDPRKLGKLGAYSVGLVWLSYIPAILLGVFGMKLGLRFSPQVPMPAMDTAVAPELPGFVDFIVNLIPRNPFEAAASGSLLPLIIFTILFAAALGTLAPERKKGIIDLMETVSDALVKLVHWILWTAPVGVFGLTAPTTAESGWAMLQSIAVFIVTVVVCLVIFWVFFYLPVIRFLGKMSLGFFHKGTLGTSAIGFGSTSSVASLPVMMEEAEDNLGLSDEVYPLVLSLLASMNKAGSALFQGASVVFLASVYDVPLPLSAVGGLFLAVFLTALTVAPVPSAGVVTLAPALDTVGVPMAGLGLLLGVDRIPDMFRSALNITGHMVWAVAVEELTIGRTGPGGSREGESPPEG
jgi:Na+/H+-dicarboxylate symporter